MTVLGVDVDVFYILVLVVYIHFRISKLNKGTAVYPAEIAQTYRLEHKADSGNPVNYNRYMWPQLFSFISHKLISQLGGAAELKRGVGFNTCT